MTSTSYASNFEDVLLFRLFGDRPEGFYVDIGADHPVLWSTTKIFYDRGWSGINVEPGPHFPLLMAERPRDTNINAVVLDTVGEVDFFVHDGLLGTSTVIEAVDPGLQAYELQRRRTRVRSITLQDLAERDPRVRSAAFIKIDAEGAEDAIVASTDWTAIRPEVLVIEATKPYTTDRCDQRRIEILRNSRYVEAYFDGINAWLLREESAQLSKHFQIPVNQLDGFVLFDPEKERLASEVLALRRYVARFEKGLPGLLLRFARRVARLIGVRPN